MILLPPRKLFLVALGFLLFFHSPALAVVPTQFTGTYFTAKESNLGMPIRIQAQLKMTSGSALANQTVYFDIYDQGVWRNIMEDDSGFTTDSSGIASTYYYVDHTLNEGAYSIRARFDGDAFYDPASFQATLTTNKAALTFALFLNADNNLEDFGLGDFYEELYPHGADTNVNYVVLFDRYSGDETYCDNWTGTRLFLLTPDGISANEYWYQDWGEQNLGDPDTLELFMEYSFTNFPADDTLLIIWSHGNGWSPDRKAFSTAISCPGTHVELPVPADVASRLPARKTATAIGEADSFEPMKYVSTDESPKDELSMAELTQALENSGHIVDVLAMDACLMGMIEVAYEVKDLARYYVASEETVPGEGFDYDDLGQSIRQYPPQDARALASLLVDSYARFYQGSNLVTLSAWDLTDMDPAFQALENLSQTLLDRAEFIPYAAKSNARADAQQMNGNSKFLDLASLCHSMIDNIDDAQVDAAAQALLDRLSESRRVNYWMKGFSYDIPSMTGLSIYWPPLNSYDLDYHAPGVIDFSSLSWDEAIRLMLDTTPPSSAVNWAQNPQATSHDSITMASDTTTDQNGNTVYYQFTFTHSPTGGTGGDSSGTRHASPQYTDQGLTPNHSYCYTVYAHDGAGNQTAATGELCTITHAQTPSQGSLSRVPCNSILVEWDGANNPEGTYYWCENTTLGTISGWTTQTQWMSGGLESGESYAFRVKAKNSQNIETDWTDLGSSEMGACVGDVNGDSQLSLDDVIICLQIASGLTPPGVRKDKSIDALQQIGLDEALYILQIVGD